jgi:hypothetical protein
MTVFHKMIRATTVSKELYQVLNRLARTHPNTPTWVAGGLIIWALRI